MENIGRRNLMTGAGALAVAASVVPVAVKADQAKDAELRELWKQYLAQLRAHDLAEAAVRERRPVFDAEYPPYPDGVRPGDHWEAHQWLWRKHGMHRLTAAWEREGRKLIRLVKAIRAAKAETMFGVGVKLAAMEANPEEYDFRHASADALRAISFLTGDNSFSKVAARVKPGRVA